MVFVLSVFDGLLLLNFAFNHSLPEMIPTLREGAHFF